MKNTGSLIKRSLKNSTADGGQYVQSANTDAEWIDNRLHQWSVWRRRHDSAALGYPRRAAFWRLTPATSAPDSEWLPPDINDQAASVDQAVSALPDRLKAVIVEHYVRGGTVTDKARALHIARRTYYERLSAAQQTVLETLRELD